MNTFVIDIDTRQNLGVIEFIPQKEDRIIINKSWKNLEYIVKCVLYYPKEHCVLVFVKIDNFYERMIADIKWKTVD